MSNLDKEEARIDADMGNDVRMDNAVMHNNAVLPVRLKMVEIIRDYFQKLLR